MADAFGAGTVVSGGAGPVTGRFSSIVDVADLLRLMDEDGQQLVAFLEHPNVTMMAPVHERLVAIVCESGDEQAHVAIVARELGIPCVVRAELSLAREELEGRWVRLDTDGTLHLASEDPPAAGG
jgi:pyruvate,water dikinase